MRAPCVVRWPGDIKPGTVLKEMFASLDWLPTFVEIAGGPKGNELKEQIKGAYKGIVKTTLDGVNQIDYLTGKTEKSARDTFFYYGRIPSAVRYKNWKLYYTMTGSDRRDADAAVDLPLDQIENIMRDPFENNVGAGPEGPLCGRRFTRLAQAPLISTTGTCCPSASCCGKRSLCRTRSSRLSRRRRPTT